ncbi:MAG TPA: polymer-forming cytoskeletal protein [Candidatus Acidoferrum sp.]|nr:polymer-forming cytoskeletal protein [Candidatus Acidoferrum sp.]
MPLGFFDRKRQPSGDWSGFLEDGVRLEGKLESPGTFRVDCRMKGDLVSEDTLILGEHALVEGQMTCGSAIIAGRFDGTIRARTRVEIHTKAVVAGEIHTPCLIIEPGGIFDGNCHVLAPRESAKPVTIVIRSAAAHA